MEIFSTIATLKDKYPNIVIALGNFDGVHAGHQKIIKHAVSIARDIHGTCVVFTFSNHPMNLICPEKSPLVITDNKSKAALIETMGVDILLNVPFTREMLEMTPMAFIRLLKQHLNPEYIVVGPNFSFGAGGNGKPSLLQQVERRFAYKTEIFPFVYKGKQPVSSTLIRALISGGDIHMANYLLNRSFTIKGIVKHGEQRGRLLGFPTANLEIETTRLAPANGVYAARVLLAGKSYRAVVNVGINPTFNGLVRHIEAYLFDFSGDIYGQELEIIFIDRIRAEKRFANKDELVEQIDKDIERTSEIFRLLCVTTDGSAKI